MQNKKEIVETKEISLNKQQRIKLEQWYAILNREPDKKFIKHHEFGNFDYLPIDHIETTLDKYFPGWSIENLDYRLVANSMCVSLDLVVIIFGDDMQPMRVKKSGVGSAKLQLDKGARPMDIDKMKGNAVEIALPVAKTRAVKNAAQSLGKIFGRSINRDEQDTYIGVTKEESKKDKIFT